VAASKLQNGRLAEGLNGGVLFPAGTGSSRANRLSLAQAGTARRAAECFNRTTTERFRPMPGRTLAGPAVYCRIGGNSGPHLTSF
jgi:hypothetical protein